MLSSFTPYYLELTILISVHQGFMKSSYFGPLALSPLQAITALIRSWRANPAALLSYQHRKCL